MKRRSKSVRIFNKKVDVQHNTVTYKGHEENVEPRLIKLLMLLFESRGTVVAKSELLEKVWDQSIVTPDSLTNAISKLRKIMDTGMSKSPIQTISGVGYLLRKPSIVQQLAHHKTTLALSAVIVFLLYVLLGSGLVEWVFSLKDHLANQ